MILELTKSPKDGWNVTLGNALNWWFLNKDAADKFIDEFDEERLIENILLMTKREDSKFPLVTELIYKYCRNDNELFLQLTDVIELFIKKALEVGKEIK